ncbi:monooxygenase [Corynespora cassiicola Philippines]|uniref:Monooxygenase n=1 Tax=Corynespora cassiicola Philippines TaxID=1448308 RepID=A0A2T2NVC4_CORCC|nr:monooxygenase [Corynespora cassiicola Philippines]
MASPTQNTHGNSEALLAEVQRKYSIERSKRLKAEGQSQYTNIHDSEQYRHFADDIFDGQEGSLPGIQLKGNDHFKFVVLGGGFGGLVFAVRLIQAGYKPEDFAIVDAASGYGGTWYWNRYPGLMCDVESYIYMPLLEETGYMPRHKYSYGYELREQANRIAAQWNLKDRGAFRTTLKTAVWDEEVHRWVLGMTQKQTPSGEKMDLQISADFVITLGGLASFPKLPRVPGMGLFEGEQFHTARWNYKVTGGSQKTPTLTNLKDKRVGIIGTGATAIQVVPRIAEWSKEVFVFQRTPSSVDHRGQRPTDPALWEKEVADKKGWQRERQANFAACTNAGNDNKDMKNMVNDAWTNFPSYSALTGGPRVKNLHPTPESIGAYLKWLHTLDLEHAERIRGRVDQVVKDMDTAQKLKAWYPGWCKRPCFHDEYLEAFNLPNVKLVDTDGKGVDELTKNGVVFQGTEYPVDVLIWSTGYAPPLRGGPDTLGGFSAVGRNGMEMKKKWNDNLSTLHGVLTHGFPNFFFMGPAGIGGSPNLMGTIDAVSEHVAYIISEAEKRSGGPEKVIIEPTRDAEEAWTQQIVRYSIGFSAMSGCTPSYFNLEGEADRILDAPPEEQAKAARAGMWGLGFTDYVSTLRDWRDDGILEGVHVTAV